MASKTGQRMAQTRERKRRDGLVPQEVWIAEIEARFLREESDRTGYPVRDLMAGLIKYGLAQIRSGELSFPEKKPVTK
ncbi:MAG: hypothetical protein ACYDAM_02955 [Leptospirales bacterium]